MVNPEQRIWKPLPREEVVKAIERRGPARIPILRAKWWTSELAELHGEKLAQMDRFPEDVGFVWIEPLEPEKMNLSWKFETEGAHDLRFVLDDWSHLDEFIAKLPDPERDPRFEQMGREAEQIRAEGRYLLFAWWRLFFERPWGIRGMQNLLEDYYLAPENIHRLHEALCDLYLGYLRRAVREFQPDGFWTSDDLGHQTAPFMRPTTFRAFLKPYYQRIGDFLRAQGLHWWLHSCGNNTPLLTDLVEVGLNVFHPVQKGTMDEVAVACAYGDQLTFLAGFDVQHILPEASPDEVRAEVRHLIDTFDGPGGGMCLAAGNGITSETPLENIEAFLDEAYTYGLQHRQRMAKQQPGAQPQKVSS